MPIYGMQISLYVCLSLSLYVQERDGLYNAKLSLAEDVTGLHIDVICLYMKTSKEKMYTA